MYKLDKKIFFSGYTFFILITFVAFFLRLYGLNWDNRTLFHPDERALLMQVNNIHFPELSKFTDIFNPNLSPLHPGSFNWGSFPHYLLKIIAYIISPFNGLDIYELRYPGRIIMAISDVVTIGFVYLICREYFSRRIAVIASIFSTFSVINIQLSHFFAVDILMTTLSVATIYFCLRVIKYSRVIDSVMVGVFFGLAIATKFSVSPLIIPIILSHVISGNFFGGRNLSFENIPNYIEILKKLLIFAISTFLVLLFVQPYMFLDIRGYFSDIFTQSSMVRMNVDWPFTRQYIDTPRYWYQIIQSIKWGLGPVLGILCWLSLIHIIFNVFKTKRKVEIVILSWVIPYFLITGWFDVKFLRYMLPIVPFLLIFASRSLVVFSENFFSYNRIIKITPLLFILLFTIHYSLSFINIYSTPHPSVVASDWLKENAKKRDIVIQEHWDEGFPPVNGLILNERLEMYNPDSIKKFSKITNQLEESDFLVLITNRLYGTIPRLEDRYPISSHYYRLLFEEKLGYELVFQHYKNPNFLGITYIEDPLARVNFVIPETNNDQEGIIISGLGWADESFNVYDHPHVLIFQNTSNFSSEKLLELLEVGKFHEQIKNKNILDTNANWLNEMQGKKIFFSENFPTLLLILFWYLAIQILALSVLPFVMILFWKLPDKGYLLSKILGLLLVSAFTWLVVSLGIIQFSLISISLSILFFTLVSLFFLRIRFYETIRWLYESRKKILIWESIFLVTFILFLLIRFYNPDLWHPYRGGEKPMDFAYLNAIIKTTSLPPYDPWFSGGYMNYYYFGQFMVANLIILTGIIPSISYNLAVASFFSFSAIMILSILSNFQFLFLRSIGFPFWYKKFPWFISIFGIFVVLIFGNIDGLFQFGGIISDYIFGEKIRGFDYWRSSRMMDHSSMGFEITEFPFFTFLFADLHAHLLVIPITLAGILMIFSHFLSIGTLEHRYIKILRLLTLGILFGVIWITNTWSYPTIIILSIFVILGGELLFGYGHILKRFIKGIIDLSVITAISYLFFLPFHNNFELFNNGIVISKYQTNLWRFIAIHFFFIFSIFSWIVVNHIIYAPKNLNRSISIDFLFKFITKYLLTISFIVISLLLVLTFIFSKWITLIFLLFFGLIFIGISILSYIRQPGRNRYLFLFVSLTFLALCISIGVEIITIKGDIGRMNTVFKFYLQSWILFGLSSVYFLGDIFYKRDLLKRFKFYDIFKYIWISLFLFFIFSGVIYSFYAIPTRNSDRFININPSLNGNEYMNEALCTNHCYPRQTDSLSLYHDLNTINWFRQNVSGSPVIVEGVTDLYMWGNRISINTGLPAVIGWDWHQKQQRANYTRSIESRIFDVKNFYLTGSTEKAIEFLDKYRVKYVVVGELERRIYNKVGILKFEKMESLGLKKVYSSEPTSTETTIIYEYK